MAPPSNKRKRSLYFPGEMLAEIQREATRQHRSLSWIVEHAWKVAHPRVAKLPGTEDLEPSVRDPADR